MVDRHRMPRGLLGALWKPAGVEHPDVMPQIDEDGCLTSGSRSTKSLRRASMSFEVCTLYLQERGKASPQDALIDQVRT